MATAAGRSLDREGTVGTGPLFRDPDDDLDEMPVRPQPIGTPGERPVDDAPANVVVQAPRPASQIDESFAGLQLDLDTFVTPARRLRVRDDALELGVGARFAKDAPTAGTALELEEFANFESVSARLSLAHSQLSGEQGTSFSLRAHVYDTGVSTGGLRPAIHAVIHVGDQGDGPRARIEIQQETRAGFRTLESATLPDDLLSTSVLAGMADTRIAVDLGITLSYPGMLTFDVGQESRTLTGPGWMRAVRTRVGARVTIDGPPGRAASADARVSRWVLNRVPVPDPAALSERVGADRALGTRIGTIGGYAYLSAAAPADGERMAELATRNIETDGAGTGRDVSIGAVLSVHRWLPGASVSSVALTGSLYNAAQDRDRNRRQADVVGSVGIRDTDTGDLQAYALIERVLDAQDTQRLTLLEHVFEMRPSTGTDYPVAMSVSDGRVTIDVGAERVEHIITTLTGPPWSTGAAVRATASASGRLEGRVDRLTVRR